MWTVPTQLYPTSRAISFFQPAQLTRICAVHSHSLPFDWAWMDKKITSLQKQGKFISSDALSLLYLYPLLEPIPEHIQCTVWDCTLIDPHHYRKRIYTIPQKRIKHFGWAMIYRPILLNEFERYARPF